MDTTSKNLNKEEKENVLMVLNEFSEDHKANTKSVSNLIISVTGLSQKVDVLLNQSGNTNLKNEAGSKLEELIKDGVEKITVAIHDNAIPINELQELSQYLQQNIMLFKNPTPQRVIHHHHINKLIWLAAGLFVGLTLLSVGWYATYEKLDGYIANDTKYRSLKLDTANIYLQKMLYRTDTLYQKNANMREMVMNMEEEYRNNFELLQKASQMNAEAENLKAGAKKLKQKAVGK